MTRTTVFAAAIAALTLAAPAAHAQNYPNRPITFIIGFAPGGPSDVLSRIIGRRMEQELKQPMIIENRAGAGGSYAAQLVTRAAPDGYTVMLGTNAALTINPNIQKNVGYNAETRQIEDLLEAGIVDPAKVVRAALQNAASIAGLLLTTDAAISDVPEKAAEDHG